MHVNFLRTGVGVESVAHLYEIQQDYRRLVIDGHPHGYLITKRTPTRVNDLLNGGSVYWIIKRQICARQDIVDIQTLEDDEGKKFCRILMNSEIIMTAPIAHRHIQGWRYLMPEKAPEDLRPFDPSEEKTLDIDPKMVEELKELGLL